MIGNYIIDFYCHRIKLWIEIDDESHDYKWEYDEKRTEYLNKLWIKIIRYKNKSIYKELDAVIKDLEIKIEERLK
jgi:very-short-patch-repair endonuclease